MSIEAIVFDLDDTIYPEEQYVLSGFASVDAWLKAEFKIHGFLEHANQIFGRGIRGNIFDQALVSLGVKCDPELIQRLVQVYREHSPNISAYEDAKWALDHFLGQYKMGLITDGYLVAQRNKVKALDIEGYFDTIVFTDVYGRENWKPSLVPYTIAMQELGCAHQDIVYVGDNPSKDFFGAKKLGWLTVQVSRTEGQYCNVQVPEDNYSADFCIESLTDLTNILR
jgi:putative hydrolase of the HAD superfamily